jgi:Tol biopolymer transport system component
VGKTTERVSISPAGVQGDDQSLLPALSSNGRYVAFESVASNLVPGHTNGELHVFVRDRLSGTTTLVSQSTGGAQGNGVSSSPSISDDGRIVAFQSEADNLVGNDTNADQDVFVRDLMAGTTRRISVGPMGQQVSQLSAFPSVSDDGRYVAFDSADDNLIPGDTNGVIDVFVRDLMAGTTERVSVATNGDQSQGADNLVGPVAISGDGLHVAFASTADNLVEGDTNGLRDAFVRNLG